MFRTFDDITYFYSSTLRKKHELDCTTIQGCIPVDKTTILQNRPGDNETRTNASLPLVFTVA